MKNRLVTVAVILLACMNVLTFVYATQTKEQMNSVQKTVVENPSKVIVYESEDGYTPVKGIDYFDGADGISSMSYTVNTVTIKEMPVMGPMGPAGADGKDGKDAVSQEFRINPETGDFETKPSDQRGWTVMITCDRFVSGCGAQP